MTISPEDFRLTLSRFASGVTVVTTKDADGNLYGLTVSAFTSVSLDPPLVLICIENTAGSIDALKNSKMFVVNVLNSEQTEVSERFASPAADKFAETDHELNIDGIPVISNCIANITCGVVETYDGGDHTIFVGHVDDAVFGDGDPLVYFRSGYHTIGDR
jgi:flavin reductase ActVB